MEMHHVDFAAVGGELPLELLTRQRRASTQLGSTARSEPALGAPAHLRRRPCPANV
jgi:hypothetical protein